MTTAADRPLRSVHTTTLPRLLADLGATLLVSTYQAGKLIAVRADGAVANTHFRDLDVPMGLARDGNRLAVGTRTGIWEFRDQPAAAPRLPGDRPHDACYLPRAFHVSGHIAVHEIAFAGDELWAVNTRFSCLCTFDRNHSFTPRWRPPFVSAYSPEDRCHLNGFCLVDGAPKYVTALGATDSVAAWRANKATGGVLLEVPSGRVVAAGLSMPHSPRVHDGRLWVLESGAGRLATVDPATGRLDTVALLPGFARGLDFLGPYAFIGLSQVRETALFSGIPITERLPVEERKCGVWVIDTRDGRVAAFVQFTDGVQEVFAVLALPGLRWPEFITDVKDELVASAYVLPDAALAEVAVAPGEST